MAPEIGWAGLSERLYVMGHPVSHSKSPALYNAAARALGFSWEYGLMDIEDADEARRFIERGSFLALNVTTPFKPLALRAAARSTLAARLSGGANLLVRTGDGLVADNVDGAGCVAYLERCGAVFSGSRVAVCGTGPTSLSIVHAVLAAGASRVSLVGRDAGRASKVRARYLAALDRLDRSLVAVSLAGGSLDRGCCACAPARLRALDYASAAADLAAADLIVDATSLGMHAGDPAPFDTALLSSGQIAFDVVYGHGETALIKAARQAGCQAFDGEGMLVAQAELGLRGIAAASGCAVDFEGCDLFGVMAQAAGFVALASA